MHYDLQEKLNSVILSVGDIIIDTFSGYTGMLVKRERRIDRETAIQIYLKERRESLG